jgi:hypothetical protein
MRVLFIFLISMPLWVSAQKSHPVVDSLKRALAHARTDGDKVSLLGDIAQILMTTDRAASDAYSQQLTEVAEMSRDRKLIIRALILNGKRIAMLGSFKGNTEKAMGLYNEALSVARENKLDDETVSCHLALSAAYRSVPDADKALSHCNEANSYMGPATSDSLRVLGMLEYGAVYTARREKLLALRSFFAALRLSEEKGLVRLQRQSYAYLAGFYGSIEEYDRAIDYAVRSLELRKQLTDPQARYNQVEDLTNIGNLYGYKKSYDMARFYFAQAVRLADSLKFAPLKMSAYIGMLNNYLYASQPQQALAFFNGADTLKAYLRGFGYEGIIDQAYGYIYTDLNRFDSAYYYYARSAPLFENSLNNTSRYSFYVQMGRLHNKAGRYNESIDYYGKARTLATQMSDLKAQQVVVSELDTLYRKTGHFKEALEMTALTLGYRDSLDKLGKEKDLMQIEAADELDRQQRLDAVKKEQKEKRHRIQYLGITIAIAASFLLLAMTGFFRVSQKAIKLVGFFSFLMFFEFLFLLFKKSIGTITQGEPWKDLAFMIALAAVLLPLHHWVEEKAIHFLVRRREGNGKSKVENKKAKRELQQT